MDREELVKRLEWFEKKHGPYIEKRGFQNWRNLFRKPTMSELTVLVMIILGLFMGWAYQQDTLQCRETLENLEATCINYCGGQTAPTETEQGIGSLNFTLAADILKDD